MPFTDQKPFVVTPEIHRSFNRSRERFCCSLCGKIFQIGETVRWVYANSPKGARCGNFFVCKEHDTPDVLDRAKESFRQAKKLAKQWGVYGPDWQ